MLTARRAFQRGLTLVELLVAMTLGVLIVMATVALYSVTSSSATTSSEEQGIQDSGRFALMVIGFAARQAGFVNLDINTPVTAPSQLALQGLDNAQVTGTLSISNVGTARASGDLGGDSIAFRYQAPTTADSSMPDCLGRNPVISAVTDVAMSVFWVGSDVDGEPALRCASGGTAATFNTFTSQPLVRGVENMEVLYGVDTDADSIPNQWLSATGVAALATPAGLSNSWEAVVALRVGLVIRGAQGSSQVSEARTFYPLGQDFATTSFTPAAADTRLRRVFTATFQLRNPARWGA